MALSKKPINTWVAKSPSARPLQRHRLMATECYHAGYTRFLACRDWSSVTVKRRKVRDVFDIRFNELATDLMDLAFTCNIMKPSIIMLGKNSPKDIPF